MPGALTFRLLGPLEVLRADGSSLDLGGPQARLLLGRLLVAEGRAVAADALVDLLWDQSPPASATGMVQTYVSRLRRSFGDDRRPDCAIGSGGYSLDVGDAEVDSRRFEQLAAEGGRAAQPRSVLRRRAAAGRALACGVARCSSDLDADFARTAAARLEERRLAATEDLYDAELRSGRHAAVVPDLSDAVARFPLRERLRGLLALALLPIGPAGRRARRPGRRPAACSARSWGWIPVASCATCRARSWLRTRASTDRPQRSPPAHRRRLAGRRPRPRRSRPMPVPRNRR